MAKIKEFTQTDTNHKAVKALLKKGYTKFVVRYSPSIYRSVTGWTCQVFEPMPEGKNFIRGYDLNNLIENINSQL